MNLDGALVHRDVSSKRVLRWAILPYFLSLLCRKADRDSLR